MVEQNLLLLLVLTPFVSAALAATLPIGARNAEAWLAGLTMIVALVILGVLYPAVTEGRSITGTFRWVSSIGLDLTFRIDGFSWLFMVLVAGIGFLVILYARYYMSPDDPVPRLYSSLLAFCGAMSGLLLSGNIIMLVVFWELTSIVSFLLIGYWFQRQDARDGARMSLIVTASGGLCLMVAMIILGQIAGSYELDAVLKAGPQITSHRLYPVVLILFVLGAFTKSAQFPFHFWLPNAMAAPTPVSAAPDAQGFLWPAGATRGFLRQVVLWNQGHDGPDRCINPLIREWGISEGSMETLFLALYSHFPYPLDGYEFELDVPVSFRLLDIIHPDGRNLLNLKPSGVTTEPVEHDGRKYTRYRIAEPPNQVRRDRIGGLLLPLFLEQWTDRERTTAWYYRRLGKGNFTELLQKIPVRILPPINGRLPKKIMLSQYCSVPWDYCRLSAEHLDQHLRQSFRAGFNTWIISRLGVDQDAYLKTVHDRVLDAGGRIILWNNYPYYGLKNTAKLLGYRWLETHPEARARYFEDSESWEKRDQYCPTYVLGPGRAAFGAEVKAAYAAMLKALPGASIVWSDWEEVPWVSAGSPGRAARDGNGSWCFCDGCKSAFRAWARLPADEDLADAAIFGNHKAEWEAFRVDQDGRVAAIAKQAANALGKPYMLYSWTAHTKLWDAVKGNIDLGFPGCPGNAASDAYQQRHLDETMARFADRVGLSRDKVMGQRFSFFYYYQIAEPQEFWRKWSVMSPSGYVEPKTWKTQILRGVAALGMGIDLQSSLECSGGMLYWIGEATRILATYEDLFHDGQRDDALATCDTLEYPNVLVLKRGAERLVLLFNESDQPRPVTLKNRDVRPGQTATVYGTDQKTDGAAGLRLTIPAEDVAVVHIR